MRDKRAPQTQNSDQPLPKKSKFGHGRDSHSNAEIKNLELYDPSDTELDMKASVDSGAETEEVDEDDNAELYTTDTESDTEASTDVQAVPSKQPTNSPQSPLLKTPSSAGPAAFFQLDNPNGSNGGANENNESNTYSPGPDPLLRISIPTKHG